MVETIFNGCEAILWLVFAVVVAVRFHHSNIGIRRTARVTAAFFVVFAVSDVIEMQTGAWWRPAGLLVLKGVCLVGLTWCFVILLRRGRAKQVRCSPAGNSVRADRIRRCSNDLWRSRSAPSGLPVDSDQANFDDCAEVTVGHVSILEYRAGGEIHVPDPP